MIHTSAAVRIAAATIILCDHIVFLALGLGLGQKVTNTHTLHNPQHSRFGRRSAAFLRPDPHTLAFATPHLTMPHSLLFIYAYWFMLWCPLKAPLPSFGSDPQPS